ncbi:MAG: tetratricopeptide repeat protein [Bryobacteraceae bacterium]
MNPFERLREIVTALGLTSEDTGRMWFDGSNPVCRDAERLLRAGRAAEAEAAFQSVLREPRYAALAKKHMPRILLALAEAQIRQEKWDEADQTGARAWALLSELRHRSAPEFLECCRLRAQAAKGCGALEQALQFTLHGLEALEEQKNPKPAEVIRRRIEAAGLLRELKRFEEAEERARAAVEYAAKHLEGGRDHGDALLEWAICLAANRKFEEAREAGEKAAEIHRAACGDYSSEVAQVYEKLGSICQQQGDYPAAVSYLEKALNVKEHQVGGDSSELALLLVALADLYTLIGRLAPALELLQQAVGKLGPSKDSNLAGALEKLAAMYVRTGRYQDAADCYQRAFDFWSADPETYGERITANRQAVQELLPLLPEPAAVRPTAEAPDPGISVLRAGQQAGEPRGPAFPPAAGAAFPGSTPGGSPASASGGAVTHGAQAIFPAPAVAPPAKPFHPLANRESLPAPGPPISPVWQAPAMPTGAGTGGGSAALPSYSIPVQAPPSAAHPVSSASAAWRTGTGSLPATGSLRALNEFTSVQRDAYGFYGWEELEFETLRR